jgi:phosphatidylinositol alpha 1,6-mannosyltransferase
MRIALVSDSFVPMRDGVAQVTNGLAQALAAAGHDVRVFAPGLRGVPSREEVHGVSVRRVRSVPVPLYGQYRWPLFPFTQIRAIGHDADVIHLQTPGLLGTAGFLAARRYRLPLLGTFHTNLKEMAASVPQKFLVPAFFRAAWWYNLGTYYRCDLTTAPSAAAREALLLQSRKPFRRDVVVVPNGVDIARLTPGGRVPDWRLRCGLSDAPLLTFLGRLTADKGIHRFLDLVATLAAARDVVAIVGGRGPEEIAVRARLASDPVLARAVRYVGPVAEEEKAALLGQTDVFVLPSTSDTSSVALLEAMACGAAVVGPSVGGAAEVIHDGLTGLVVDPRQPEALRAAVGRLLDRPADRRRLAADGERWVRTQASLEAMARRFISLYTMLTEEKVLRGHRLVA